MKTIALFLAPILLGIQSTELKIKNANQEKTFSEKFTQQLKPGRMSAVEFKYQQYCRLEVPDFEFDVKFELISTDIYFTGANFNKPEKATINSVSLKPAHDLMMRCIPGTMVIFDNIKVKGPDGLIRTIDNQSFLLY